MDRPITVTFQSDSGRRLAGVVAFVAALVLAAALVAGLGAGIVGWPVLLVIIALPFGVVVFKRPFFGVVLIAATVPLDRLLTSPLRGDTMAGADAASGSPSAWIAPPHGMSDGDCGHL